MTIENRGDAVEGLLVLACLALRIGLPSVLTWSYLFCENCSLYSSLYVYLKSVAQQSHISHQHPVSVLVYPGQTTSYFIKMTMQTVSTQILFQALNPFPQCPVRGLETKPKRSCFTHYNVLLLFWGAVYSSYFFFCFTALSHSWANRHSYPPLIHTNIQSVHYLCLIQLYLDLKSLANIHSKQNLACKP